MLMHSNIHIHTHTLMYTLTHTHPDTYIHTYSHSHTLIHIFSHSYTFTWSTQAGKIMLGESQPHFTDKKIEL